MKKILATILALGLIGAGVYFYFQNREQTPSRNVFVEATSAEIADLVAANNQFAFELFEKYSDADGNIFFSPFSISSALAMTFEGARGETANEMRSVFHFPADAKSRREQFKNIFDEINRGDKNYELATANAIWAQKNYKFLDEYFATIKNFYDGEIRNLDFASDTENSRITINEWVEQKTRDKIKNLLQFLSPDTRLVLTNAIYFKGDWAEQFKKENTRDREFELISGEKIETPTMFLSEEFDYFENENWQILELPYRDDELSMLVFLPRKNNSTELDAGKFAELAGKLRSSEVEVYLPKFKLETRYSMAEDLKKMGMPTAFSGGADFSGMTGSRDLFISKIIHQAFVEVDEEGTEAAAATAVVMQENAIFEPEPTPVFRADHPFIFAIRENANDEILFLGRVVDPRG